MQIRPPQTDPTGLASDPEPFAPHEGDSRVVAELRRACALNASPRALRKIVREAQDTGPTAEGDRAMLEALIAESLRRPLRPGTAAWTEPDET
jgi:hypothetical protein